MELRIILSKACAWFARRSIQRGLHRPCLNRSCWLPTMIEAPCGGELHDAQRRAICSWWSDTATLLPSGRCYGSSTNGFSVGKANSYSTPMIFTGTPSTVTNCANMSRRSVRGGKHIDASSENNSAHPLSHVVWLYRRFCLSLRDTEDSLSGTSPCPTRRFGSGVRGSVQSTPVSCGADRDASTVSRCPLSVTQHDAVQEQSSRPH
jgi:hypothetical protein